MIAMYNLSLCRSSSLLIEYPRTLSKAIVFILFEFTSQGPIIKIPIPCENARHILFSTYCPFTYGNECASQSGPLDMCSGAKTLQV